MHNHVTFEAFWARPKVITVADKIYLNLLKIYVNGTLKCDHIKRLITLTSDNNERLSLYNEIHVHLFFVQQVDGDQTLVQFPLDSGKKDKEDSGSSGSGSASGGNAEGGGGSLLISNNVRILPREQLQVCFL